LFGIWAGARYWVKFNDWFMRQSPDLQRRFGAKNPEPPGWAGCYVGKGVVPG